jgi:hypothetical protein
LQVTVSAIFGASTPFVLPKPCILPIDSVGTKGGWQGVSGAWRDLGHSAGRVKSEGGKKGGKELLEKAAENECVFIPGKGSGWEMKPAQTPYRTRLAVSETTGPLNRMA